MFDCDRCPWGRHCDDDFGWPGSKGPAPYPMWEIPGVIRTTTCLKPMVTGEEWKIVSLYRHYKNGFLPREGGLYDQPQIFLEAMATMESQIEKNAQAEAEREHKRRNLSAGRRR